MAAPKRTARLTVRIRPHESALIHAAAEASQRTLSEFVREIVVAQSKNVVSEYSGTANWENPAANGGE